MELQPKIHAAYQTAKNYPDLVTQLIQLGILSYTVDVATSAILYRIKEGENILHREEHTPRTIEPWFDEQKTIKAIRDNQQGKSDYPTFMNDIANAGVRFYEATLNGPDKRVTYIGTGGFYEEKIPL